MGANSKNVILQLQNISKSYGKARQKIPVVQEISFDVYENEFLVILGPGLCGKTVLLNLIVGIDTPDDGRITYHPQGGEKEVVTGMVFQKLALMPWKTVMENVEIGRKVSGMKKAKRREICQKYIDLVELQGFEQSYPHQLSGGMKQRVGIARAYSINPDVLVMDEPFGQLDAQTRYVMENELLRIWEKEKRTIVFVTNNIEEALYLGDRILLLSKCPAKIQEEIDIKLERPRNTMSQEFLDIRTEISEKMDLSL